LRAVEQVSISPQHPHPHLVYRVDPAALDNGTTEQRRREIIGSPADRILIQARVICENSASPEAEPRGRNCPGNQRQTSRKTKRSTPFVVHGFDRRDAITRRLIIIAPRDEDFIG